MSKRPISEDDLQAFVDNALDGERRSEVSEYLLSNADAALRVASYQNHASAMRQAFDPIAKEPVPSRLNLANIAASRRSARPDYLRMAAAAVVLLAAGTTSGWIMRGYSVLPNEGVAALAQEASATYGAFAADTLRPVEVRADGTKNLEQLASVTLNGQAVIPDLSKAGYRLMGGRVIPTTHGSGIMLMYDNDKGSRLVMLSRRMLVDQDKPMASSASGSTNGWSWAKGGMGYSLVGSLPADELHPIADAMRSQV
jgi:anti-sigma factor RsiW